MPIRFASADAYAADINALRAQIRANATLVNIVEIPLNHPLAPGVNLSVLVNLAYQANSNLAPATASLYLVGIRNPQGTWCFNIPLIPLPGQRFPGNPDGSYGSLGYVDNLPAITYSTLANDLSLLGHYGGGDVGPTQNASLTRLIISVSEAARFDQISAGVGQVLVNGSNGEFNPPVALVHAWGGHTLGA